MEQPPPEHQKEVEPTVLTVRSATAVLIGDELLSGKVQEQNLAPLAQTLSQRGIRLVRVGIVPDEPNAIGSELRAALACSDVVFTSGGVGPTHDDVTVHSVARTLDVEVVQHPELEELLRSVYGAQCSPAHLAMARVPAGACLKFAGDLRWPAIVAGKVWLMPGVPELFRMKLSIVHAHLCGPAPLYGCALYLRVNEPELKLPLDAVVAASPTVRIGSYPKWFDDSYRTQVTFDSEDASAALHALQALRDLLAPQDVVRIDPGSCRSAQ